MKPRLLRLLQNAVLLTALAFLISASFEITLNNARAEEEQNYKVSIGAGVGLCKSNEYMAGCYMPGRECSHLNPTCFPYPE